MNIIYFLSCQLIFLVKISRPHGLLSIEHSGKPAHSNDGSCATLIISVRIPLEDVVLIDKYAWLELDRSLGDEILGRLGKNMTVPLAVIR